MSKMNLWNIIKDLKSDDYFWVDLSRDMSPKTPHWSGFDDMKAVKTFDYYENKNNEPWQEAPMRVYVYTFTGQYGTHVDMPSKKKKKGRNQEELMPKEMVYPLCVIDKSKEVAQNPDFILTKNDILKWEEEYGKIPENAFVAFRSDWHKREENFDNIDENGIPHNPGWDADTIEFLVKERNIGAIGHEYANTDPAFITMREGMYPYPAEKAILSNDRIQIELMAHLDQCPATGGIIICTFPKVIGGTGFPVRCIGIFPKE